MHRSGLWCLSLTVTAVVALQPITNIPNGRQTCGTVLRNILHYPSYCVWASQCMYGRVPFLWQSSQDDEPFDNGNLSEASDDEQAFSLNQKPLPSENQNQDDMTDRFKYKVNALMGAFDPMNPDQDNERTSGNILNAMLKFPMDYSFHVVGKTKGDKKLEESFIQQVKAVVSEGSGSTKDRMICYVTPRGKSFTKVTVEVPVDSAAIITSIYDQLGALELSVMQF